MIRFDARPITRDQRRSFRPEEDKRCLISDSVIIDDPDASLPVRADVPPHQLFNCELLNDAQMCNKSKVAEE